MLARACRLQEEAVHPALTSVVEMDREASFGMGCPVALRQELRDRWGW